MPWDLSRATAPGLHGNLGATALVSPRLLTRSSWRGNGSPCAGGDPPQGGIPTRNPLTQQHRETPLGSSAELRRSCSSYTGINQRFVKGSSTARAAGGFDMGKWRDTKAKMNPVMDERLARFHCTQRDGDGKPCKSQWRDRHRVDGLPLAPKLHPARIRRTLPSVAALGGALDDLCAVTARAVTVTARGRGLPTEYAPERYIPST